jgi:hypothetical protein
MDDFWIFTTKKILFTTKFSKMVNQNEKNLHVSYFKVEKTIPLFHLPCGMAFKSHPYKTTFYQKNGDCLKT